MNEKTTGKKLLTMTEKILLGGLMSGEIDKLDFLRRGIDELTEIVEGRYSGNVDFLSSEEKYYSGMGYIERTKEIDEQTLESFRSEHRKLLSRGYSRVQKKLNKTYKNPYEDCENESGPEERERREELEKRVGGFKEPHSLGPSIEEMISPDDCDFGESSFEEIMRAFY